MLSLTLGIAVRSQTGGFSGQIFAIKRRPFAKTKSPLRPCSLRTSSTGCKMREPVIQLRADADPIWKGSSMRRARARRAPIGSPTHGDVGSFDQGRNAVANFGRKCIPAWDRGCSTRQRWKVSRFAMGFFTVRTRGITRKAVPLSRSDSSLFQIVGAGEGMVLCPGRRCSSGHDRSSDRPARCLKRWGHSTIVCSWFIRKPSITVKSWFCVVPRVPGATLSFPTVDEQVH
jgi:hypothetical protein